MVLVGGGQGAGRLGQAEARGAAVLMVGGVAVRREAGRVERGGGGGGGGRCGDAGRTTRGGGGARETGIEKRRESKPEERKEGKIKSREEQTQKGRQQRRQHAGTQTNSISTVRA